MASIFDNFFGSQTDVVNRNLINQGQRAVGQAIRTANSAANRGAVSPAALSASAAQAGNDQRAALAERNAQMMAQAQAADQQRVGQMIGGLLQTGGQIGGMAMGGPAGGAVGGQLGGMAGDISKNVAGGQQPPPQPQQQGPGGAAQGTPTNWQEQGIPGGMDMSQLPKFFLSDEESKNDLRNAANAIDIFLGSLNPQSFQYNNPSEPGARPGRTTGVTTQDMARGGPVGRSLVRRDPATGRETVDSQAALQALMGAAGQLHRRLESLEEGERVQSQSAPSPHVASRAPGARQPARQVAGPPPRSYPAGTRVFMPEDIQARVDVSQGPAAPQRPMVPPVSPQTQRTALPSSEIPQQPGTLDQIINYLSGLVR